MSPINIEAPHEEAEEGEPTGENRLSSFWDMLDKVNDLVHRITTDPHNNERHMFAP